MKKITITCLMSVLIFYFTQGQCVVSSSGNSISSLINSNWGQSFVADCNGKLESITFNAATNISNTATLTVKDGVDCNANILHTQSLNSIVDGNNSVALNQTINLTQGNTYYFSVKTDNDAGWKVRFKNTNQVAGNLRTYLNGASTSSCGRNLTSFDWNFSTSIITPENIDLFIWAGQSNALGWKGDADYYPSDPNNLDSQIRLNYTIPGKASSNGWLTAMQPQMGRTLYPQGHFGPEVTFSRKLKEAGYNPAIFKFTKGATSIYSYWKTPGNGGRYDIMVTTLNTAIDQLEAQGHTVNVRGFIWIQGETDGENSIAANAYSSNLLSIINDLRNNVLNNSTLPIMLGVDEQHRGIVGEPAVLNAHHNIAASDSQIEFTSMVGLPKADPTHLTPAGLITHGERISNDFLCLVGSAAGNCDTLQCTVSSSGNSTSGLTNSNWGQSFVADCSGNLQLITFNAATRVPSNATLTIRDGVDCNSNVLHTQSLNSIVDGINYVTLPLGTINLTQGNTYYFNVKTNNNTGWQIRFNNTNQIAGNLKTYLSGASTSSCGRSFTSFDWDFSTSIGTSLLVSKNINLKETIFNKVEKNLVVYPNPAINFVTLKFPKIELQEIRVYNIIGMEVTHKVKFIQISEEQLNIDLSNLNSGVYMIKAQNSTNKIYKK